MKKIRNILPACGAILLAWFCMTNTSAVSRAVESGAMRCLNVIVPSLYAMLITAGLLTSCGLVSAAGKILQVPGRLLMGMDGSSTAIFIFSQLAGYPVGTKMLCGRLEEGTLSKRQAELLSGLCCGAGPAFIFGCISGRLYGTPLAGRLIVLSAVGANLVLALIMSAHFRRYPLPNTQSGGVNFTAEMLTSSVVSGGRSMAAVCFMVMAFAVVNAMLNESGLLRLLAAPIARISGRSPETAAALLSAGLDVTAAELLPAGDLTLLPVICGLVSFGGVCVIMQLSAVAGGKISLLPLVMIRIAAGVLSGVICRLLLPFFLVGESTAVSALHAGAYRSASPVPSILLLVMTAIVFEEYNKLVRDNGKN